MKVTDAMSVAFARSLASESEPYDRAAALRRALEAALDAMPGGENLSALPYDDF